MILALFAGIGDLVLALTLKKPKESQCFWLRTLKNLRKINVFAFPEHLVTLGASILDLKSSSFPRPLAPSVTSSPPFAGREPLIVKIYIQKLPIHRMHAAG